MATRHDTGPPEGSPARGTHVVASLEQARALIGPLRVRILQEFVEAPRTTKQVAERLGEKPTRLYRHVDALAAAGLLEFKGERRKRGTVERYFQAIASRFEVDGSLLSGAGPGAGAEAEVGAEPGAGEGEARGMIRSLLQRAGSEALDAIERGQDDDPLGPFVLRADIRAGTQEVRRLRQKLLEWVGECQAATRSAAAAQRKGEREFGALAAFFPVNPERPRR